LAFFYCTLAIAESAMPKNDHKTWATLLLIIIVSVLISAYKYCNLPKAWLIIKKDINNSLDVAVTKIITSSNEIDIEGNKLSSQFDSYPIILTFPGEGTYKVIIYYKLLGHGGDEKRSQEKSIILALNPSSDFPTNEIVILS